MDPVDGEIDGARTDRSCGDASCRDDTGYFGTNRAQFVLFTSPGRIGWRVPQFGALGALAAHWSLPQQDPALVSLPTGTGKTTVAVAAAHLCVAKRVLVVVPSVELRRQAAAAFASESVLLGIGALRRDGEPRVREVKGRIRQWAELESADVVVALPNSISPVHYPENPPPSQLFDLIVVDEAHHAPAPTWRAILTHFSSPRAVLLTATPQRRDGQRLPGIHVYHYPLRQALRDGIFKPVEAHLLAAPDGATKAALDQVLADEVAVVLSDRAHETSSAIIRAASRQRAIELASLYEQRDVSTRVLHAGLSSSTQQTIIDGLRSGKHRAVAVVGMLQEGFDLPSLRVVAYHDKHKSLPATAQLIGRLARVDDRFPQPSILVTIRDPEVYPELRGALRSLYEEDADWASILPGILDEEVAEAAKIHQYAAAFPAQPPSLSIESVHPLRRATIFEIPPQSSVPPTFVEGKLPDDLQPGRLLRGSSILYSGLSQDARTILIFTSAINRPSWHADPGLDSPTYDLHVVSCRQPPQAHLPTLLFLNTGDYGVGREILRAIGADGAVRRADPGLLHEAFDSLPRISVSSVGVRNTYAGRGTASYRSFAGSGVDRGLRDADTAFGSLGHAMIQVSDPDGVFTAGVSPAKWKYWESRHVPLRAYDEWLTGLAERYWFPPSSPTGQLLPQVLRGKRLAAWPASPPLVALLNHALIGTGWSVAGTVPLESFELHARALTSSGSPDQLPLEIVDVQSLDSPVVWRGHQRRDGTVCADGADLTVRRGFGQLRSLAELLSEHPPTIFFMDGTTVHGALVFDSRAGSRQLPGDLFQVLRWDGVNIRAETRRTAAVQQLGKSVHEALEEHLKAQPRREKRRWILCNDGKGELADYVVLEVGPQRVLLDLWHAKFAGGDPAARVTDMQEVVAQAIKSRRWMTDVGFWKELGAHLKGRANPPLAVIEGSSRLLSVLCGEEFRRARWSFTERRPLVTGTVGIVQPGLSCKTFETRVAGGDLSAIQVRDLLAVFHDSVHQVANAVTVCSH